MTDGKAMQGMSIYTDNKPDVSRWTDDEVIFAWCGRLRWCHYKSTGDIWQPEGAGSAMIPASINDLAEAARVWFNDNIPPGFLTRDAQFLGLVMLRDGPLAFLRAALEVVE